MEGRRRHIHLVMVEPIVARDVFLVTEHGVREKIEIVADRHMRVFLAHHRPRQTGMHRRDPAVRAERGAQSRRHGRTILALLHVILARPDHLDRAAADRARRDHRLLRDLSVGLSAETAAQIGRVDIDILGREAGRLFQRVEHHVMPLSRHPHVAAGVADLCSAGNRLHRNMGEKRHLVVGFDHPVGGVQARRCVAATYRRRRGRHAEPGAHRLREIGARRFVVRRRLPTDRKPVGELFCLPPAFRDDYRPAGHFRHCHGAGCRRRIDALHFRAVNR